jgi:glycosyltransferase involved in cell wall biosynthesis
MKRLLVLTSRYPHPDDTISGVFVKAQTDQVRKHFDKVLVVSMTPYVPKALVGLLDPKRRLDALARDYSYENVDVCFTRVFVPPVEKLKESRGGKELKRVREILAAKGFKPDLVHAHFAWPAGYAAMKISEEFGVPYVTTVHGYDVYDLPFRNDFYKRAVSDVLVKSAHVIFVSSELRRLATEKLCVKLKGASVIPNGYDSALFHPMDRDAARRELGLPLDAKIVLSVGALVPEKAYTYLVKAAALVAKERPEALFVIVGQGPDEPALMSVIRERGLTDTFRLVGAKPHSEIPKWMAACDVFTLSSVLEGVPTVLFEAMACGRPYAGTGVGGIKDTVTSETGITVPEKEPLELSKAIVKALTNNWDENVIFRMAERRTWLNIAKEINDVYINVMS